MRRRMSVMIVMPPFAKAQQQPTSYSRIVFRLEPRLPQIWDAELTNQVTCHETQIRGRFSAHTANHRSKEDYANDDRTNAVSEPDVKGPLIDNTLK
jgi:hypothetical protein